MATKKASPKRRKTLRKEFGIHIRVTEDQKRELAEAAERTGLGLSGWLLMLGLREAKQAERDERV